MGPEQKELPTLYSVDIVNMDTCNFEKKVKQLMDR